MNILKKNMTHRAFVFPLLRTPKKWLDKCLKSPVSDDRSTSKMVNVPTHVCLVVPLPYLLIIFIGHWQGNWVGKSQSYWHLKLGLLVSTLAGDGKYPVLNRDNLTIPIQTQLSQKQENFSQFSFAILKSTLNFKYSETKKMTGRALVFPVLRAPKKYDPQKFCLSEFPKIPVWEDSSTNNIINAAKHYRNLHHSISIIFMDHCQFNRVGKSLFYSHAKPCNCLLTHSLPMRSILFLIETI